MGLTSLPAEVASLKTLSKQAEIVEGMLETGTDLEAQLRLFLGNNCFAQLPSPILELGNLRVLSLRNNRLTSITPQIRHLTQLKTLNIAGNKLRELPFEIIELAHFHKLRELLSDPNPWISTHEYDPMQRRQIREVRGKLPRMRFVPDPTENSSGQIEAVRSKAPSLSEVCLRHLAKLNPHGHIDFKTFMPPESPQNVLDGLTLVQTKSGQQCTRCGRTVVVPGGSWLEWWALHDVREAFTFGRSVPYRRVICANNCDGGLNAWCDSENISGSPSSSKADTS
jgi:hypothetical protein